MVCWLLKSPNLPNEENIVKKSQRIEPQFPARKDYYWAYGLTLSLVSLLILLHNARIQFDLGLIQLFLGKTRNLTYFQYKNETLKKMVRF